MKTYFINLFKYDRWASELILKSLTGANSPEKPVQLMAHMLAAQQVWFNRCMGLPPAAVELWTALGTEHPDFAATIAENNLKWLNLLNALNGHDFDRIISYKSTRGDSFESTMHDIITQVINHGTHHRAQIGQLLKSAGAESLPATDYIFYLRTAKS
jgi:uncharacterized damage-inducible protein DinB